MNCSNEAAFEAVIEARLLQHGYGCVPAVADGNAAKRSKSGMLCGNIGRRQMPRSFSFLAHAGPRHGPGCWKWGWCRGSHGEARSLELRPSLARYQPDRPQQARNRRLRRAAASSAGRACASRGRHSRGALRPAAAAASTRIAGCAGWRWTGSAFQKRRLHVPFRPAQPEPP